MTIEELFRSLSYGELSNLAAAVDSTGTIKKDKQNQVVHLANQALLRLHTRYPLIQIQEVLTLTGTDLDHPFPADATKIIAIHTDSGWSLNFGTHPVPKTIHVFNRILHVPAATGELHVSYQCRHPALTPINEEGDLLQEISLISELHEALTAWIAYRMYSDIKSREGNAAAVENRTRYEEVCLEAESRGVLPNEYLPLQKFDQRGWI